MNGQHEPERRVERSRRWKLVYLAIGMLTLIVYLLLWLFSQAFLR